MSDVSILRNAVEPGDPRSTAQLLPAVYDELRRVAYLLRLRSFGGFSKPEEAQILSISSPTAERPWIYVRTCLHQRIQNARWHNNRRPRIRGVITARIAHHPVKATANGNGTLHMLRVGGARQTQRRAAG
jgi:hypothetical protein